MLRRIAAWKYGIAVATILGFSIYVSRQDQKTRDEYEKKCTQLNASTVAPPFHREDCDKGADNAARHLPRRYRVFSWPEGITAWAILLTLLALSEQTSATRRAAGAAEQSVNAAILGLEMMQSKERARISIEITSWCVRTQSPGVVYKVTSHGPTHAIVEKAWVTASLAPMFSIEWEDDETSSRRQIEIPSVFSASEIEAEEYIFGLTQEVATGIEKGDWFLHFRARIFYSDLFGKSHETAIYKIYGQATNPIYRLSGPKWVLAQSGNYSA